MLNEKIDADIFIVSLSLIIPFKIMFGLDGINRGAVSVSR